MSVACDVMSAKVNSLQTKYLYPLTGIKCGIKISKKKNDGTLSFHHSWCKLSETLDREVRKRTITGRQSGRGAPVEGTVCQLSASV